MREHKPLSIVMRRTGEKVVFLCGSIEMGAAEPWQARVVAILERLPGIVLNPRRDDWDSSWVQDPSNEQFRWQVEWELAGIERADVVIMVFDPKTKSPITLLELGLVAGFGKPTVIFCPEGFWRRGNVLMVARRYGLMVVDSLDAILGAVGICLAKGR